MGPKVLLYETKGSGSTFRLVGKNYPKEEVSTWERGEFAGVKISVLSTMIMTRKGSVDCLRGIGMISGGDGITAFYRIEGVARGTEGFGEDVTGTMVFARRCIGRLKSLRSVRASFRTIVDSKGFRTTVWKD